MKLAKLVSILAAGMMLVSMQSAHAAWTKVEDFQSYSTGPVATSTMGAVAANNATGSKWIAYKESTPVTTNNNRVDVSGANKFMVDSNSGIGAVSRVILDPTQQLNKGAISTFFFRVSPNTANLNVVFGLSDLDTGNAYADFNACIRFGGGTGNTIDAFGAGAWQVSTVNYTPGGSEWYNIWMVVDNTASTWKMYYTVNTLATATEANRHIIGGMNTYTFRRAVDTASNGGAIDRFFIRSDAAGTGKEISFDDIYMTAGEDLSNPLFIDTTPPTVVSITRPTSAANPTSVTQVVYNVKFSEAVTGVAANNFTPVVTGLGASTIASVAGSGTDWTVTVNIGTGDGTAKVNLDANLGNIKDTANNALATAFTAGELFTIDRTAPGVSSVAGISGKSCSVTFSEAMKTSTLTTAANYTISGTGMGTVTANPNSVTVISPTQVQLNWNANTMLEALTITITVTGVKDAAGNTIGATNSKSGVSVPVEMSNFSIE